MIYLDTGCLVKLYYPEPDSSTDFVSTDGRQARLARAIGLPFTPI